MSELILTHEELSNRLEIKEGEFRIDSRLVVDGFGLPNHTSYRNNILDKYEAKFKQLGVILKITLDNGEIVWYLNQAQFNFAGTLARNTEKAIDFKLNLVKAFEVATKKQVSQQYPNQIAGDISINPILDFASNLKGLIGVIYPTVEPELQTGMLVEGICAKFPEYRDALPKPKLLLEAPLLSPTDIGKILEDRTGIKRSGIAVNKLLIEKNLQIATGDKKLAYKAIGQGIEFSKVIADTAQGHGKTIQSLRWYKSVIDLLD
jgi:hypothetical protein